jgi:hypothetical protein
MDLACLSDLWSKTFHQTFDFIFKTYKLMRHDRLMKWWKHHRVEFHQRKWFKWCYIWCFKVRLTVAVRADSIHTFRIHSLYCNYKSPKPSQWKNMHSLWIYVTLLVLLSYTQMYNLYVHNICTHKMSLESHSPTED